VSDDGSRRTHVPSADRRGAEQPGTRGGELQAGTGCREPCQGSCDRVAVAQFNRCVHRAQVQVPRGIADEDDGWRGSAARGQECSEVGVG
jgi:hypothetical protein